MGAAGPEHMPETPFLRGRAALAGPRLSVFMQFIIRAPSDQYHWVFCQTGLPTRGKPHQHYHSEGIPDHVFPLSSNARAFCASSSRRHHSTRRPVYLNKGSHLPVSRYFNLLKAALFSSSSLSQCALLQTFALRQISGRLNMGLSSIFRAGKKAGPVVRHTISRMPARRGPKKTGGGSEDLR